MDPTQPKAEGGTTIAVNAADSAQGNTANTALGVSLGALGGTLLGISILPGIGLPLALVSASVIGGVVGNYAKRIAASMHS